MACLYQGQKTLTIFPPKPQLCHVNPIIKNLSVILISALTQKNFTVMQKNSDDNGFAVISRNLKLQKRGGVELWWSRDYLKPLNMNPMLIIIWAHVAMWRTKYVLILPFYGVGLEHLTGSGPNVSTVLSVSTCCCIYLFVEGETFLLTRQSNTG